MGNLRGPCCRDTTNLVFNRYMPGAKNKEARNAAVLFFALLLFCSAGVAAARYPQVIAEPSDGFFDSNGVRVHYVIAGTGDPVVLIHGFSGSAATMNGVQKELARDYQVIAVDCRGHGKSDKPHDPDKSG